jgi:hypothetical protein
VAAASGAAACDLLTEAEDRVYENRFDIELLAQRLLDGRQVARHGQVLHSLQHRRSMPRR